MIISSSTTCRIPAAAAAAHRFPVVPFVDHQRGATFGCFTAVPAVRASPARWLASFLSIGKVCPPHARARAGRDRRSRVRMAACPLVVGRGAQAVPGSQGTIDEPVAALPSGGSSATSAAAEASAARSAGFCLDRPFKTPLTQSLYQRVHLSAPSDTSSVRCDLNALASPHALVNLPYILRHQLLPRREHDSMI